MDYKELDIWIQARVLVKTVYVLTKSFPKDEQFSLTSQVRRCVISIPSNIAEGYERQTNKEFIRYLYIAKGSCGELRTQLHILKDIGLFENTEQSITLIEWPELIKEKPLNRVDMFFEYTNNGNGRIINFKPSGRLKNHEF